MSTTERGTTDLTSHLVERGLVSSETGLEVTPLTGGVSNDVVAVEAPGFEVVVKRALGRLRVAEEWLATPERLDTEGRALRLAGELLPGSAPQVHDLHGGYLVIERAPRSWRNWKEELMVGRVDPEVARSLGHALGTWQRTTAAWADVAFEFADRTAFEQLRVSPFHRSVADRHPDLAPAVELTVSVMSTARACLVHGDYTPKNVLVEPGGPGLWVIDWEVAHVGDPTFDPAWTVGHLLLKSVHRPESAARYLEAAECFLDGLHVALDCALDLDEAQLIRQVGCLLVARVDGKSPADYLTDSGRARVRDLGRRLLTDPPATTTDLFREFSHE